MNFDKLVKQILAENINSSTDPINFQDLEDVHKTLSRVAIVYRVNTYDDIEDIDSLLTASISDLQYFDSITPITDTSGTWLEYNGNSYEQATQVYFTLLMQFGCQEMCDEANKQLLRLKDISRLPGTFKVVNDQEYVFTFVFEIDMVRYKMGHILDAGSEGVSEEDNILDW